MESLTPRNTCALAPQAPELSFGAPRISLRGVRVGPEFWQGRFKEAMEKFKSMDFNACVLDAFSYSIPSDAVKDESHTGDWEVQFFEALRSAVDLGLWTLAVLPIQLDLEPHSDKGLHQVICRQTPEGRRRMIHRFESILERIPRTDAIGFSITDLGRCRCGLCEKSSFEEEAAYYLRAFAAVLRRYAPETEIWGLPDEYTWNLMQEVRGVVPTEVRFLLPDPTHWNRVRDESESPAAEREEGVRLDLRRWRGGEIVDLGRAVALARAWDTSGAPRFVVGEIDTESVPGLASLITIAWSAREAPEGIERLVFESVLPEEQRTRWRAWHSWNEHVRLLRHRVRDTGLEEFQNLQAVLVEQSLGDSSRAEERILGDLSVSLLAQVNRWIFQKQILEALRLLKSWGGELGHPPEAARVFAVVIETIRAAMEEADRNGVLEICERRDLENLADYLSLYLSESPHSHFWNWSHLPIRTAEDLGWTDEF